MLLSVLHTHCDPRDWRVAFALSAALRYGAARPAVSCTSSRRSHVTAVFTARASAIAHAASTLTTSPQYSHLKGRHSCRKRC